MHLVEVPILVVFPPSKAASQIAVHGTLKGSPSLPSSTFCGARKAYV